MEGGTAVSLIDERFKSLIIKMEHPVSDGRCKVSVLFPAGTVANTGMGFDSTLHLNDFVSGMEFALRTLGYRVTAMTGDRWGQRIMMEMKT